MDDINAAKNSVLELTATGHSIQQTCNIINDLCLFSKNVNPHTVYKWRRKDDRFAQDYARAREIGFEVNAEQLRTIHDDIHDVQKAKLASDNTKWLLSKVIPKTYGDRIDVNVTDNTAFGQALVALSERRKRLISDQSATAETQLIDVTDKTERLHTDSESVAKTQADENIDIFSID